MRCTSRPWCSQILTQRSPNAPATTTATLSPGPREVRDRRLHRAGAGRAEEQHLALGAEHLLQALERPRVDLLEVGAAVVDHRLGARGEHLGRHGRRARREQVALLHATQASGDGRVGPAQPRSCTSRRGAPRRAEALRRPCARRGARRAADEEAVEARAGSSPRDCRQLDLRERPPRRRVGLRIVVRLGAARGDRRLRGRVLPDRARRRRHLQLELAAGDVPRHAQRTARRRHRRRARTSARSGAA